MQVIAFTDEQSQLIQKFARERRTLSEPTILIVEDQYFSRKLLEELVRRYYQVYSASNIEEAIELYAQHIPCIVFLDIDLPDGSGHAFAREVRRCDPGVFIVMITANNSMSDVDVAVNNKVQGYIVKPFNKKRIFEFIDKWRIQSRKGRGGAWKKQS